MKIFGKIDSVVLESDVDYDNELVGPNNVSCDSDVAYLSTPISERRTSNIVSQMERMSRCAI